MSDPESAATYQEFLRLFYRHTVPIVSAEDLYAEIASPRPPLLLDVRSSPERSVSHIPTSEFVAFADFDVGATQHVDRDTPIVTCCTVGYRSERIGERLLAAGFTSIRHLYGGIIEWTNHRLPLERGPEHPPGEQPAVHAYSHRRGKWVTHGRAVYQPPPD